MNETMHIFYALHLLAAMLLIGITLLNLFGINKALPSSIRYRPLSLILLLQLFLGTYLVYARGYNFHIPWIQGAYLLVATTLLLTEYLAKYPKAPLIATRCLNALILCLLLLTAYEAITRINLWIPQF